MAYLKTARQQPNQGISAFFVQHLNSRATFVSSLSSFDWAGCVNELRWKPERGNLPLRLGESEPAATDDAGATAKELKFLLEIQKRTPSRSETAMTIVNATSTGALRSPTKSWRTSLFGHNREDSKTPWLTPARKPPTSQIVRQTATSLLCLTLLIPKEPKGPFPEQLESEKGNNGRDKNRQRPNVWIWPLIGPITTQIVPKDPVIIANAIIKPEMGAKHVQMVEILDNSATNAEARRPSSWSETSSSEDRRTNKDTTLRLKKQTLNFVVDDQNVFIQLKLFHRIFEVICDNGLSVCCLSTEIYKGFCRGDTNSELRTVTNKTKSRNSITYGNAGCCTPPCKFRWNKFW